MNWLKKFWQEKPRWLQLFLVNVIYVFLVILPLYCYLAPLDKDLLKGAGIWNFFTLILAIPSAFMVWYFRDQNNKESIENQRKDTNLKDFQKLSEIAAGMYLVEDKVTTEIKNSDKANETVKTESSKFYEHNQISRQDGAIALQIAAIYQLQAFLNGEYGQYFKRSTFHLLLSVWRILTEPDYIDIILIETIAKTPLAKAIESVLTAENGKAFQEHKNDLQGISLVGMHLKNIDLWDIDFSGSQFTGTKFYKVNFYNPTLLNVDFSHASFEDVKIYNPQFIESCTFSSIQGFDDPEIYIHENGIVNKNQTLELRKSLHTLGLYPHLNYISEEIPEKIKI